VPRLCENYLRKMKVVNALLIDALTCPVVVNQKQTMGCI